MVSFRATNASPYCSRQPLSADTVIGSLEYLGPAAIFVAALIALLVRSVMAFISITTTDRGSVLPLKNGATDLMQRREYEVSEHRVLIRGFEAAVDGCGIGVGTGAEAVVGAEAGGCGLTQMTGLKKMMQQKSIRVRRKTIVTDFVIVQGLKNLGLDGVVFRNQSRIHGFFQSHQSIIACFKRSKHRHTVHGRLLDRILSSDHGSFRVAAFSVALVVFLLPLMIMMSRALAVGDNCESMEKEDYEIFVAQDSTNCVVAVVDDEPPLLPQQVGVDKTMEVRATCGSPIFDHEKITTILEGLSIGSKTFVIVLTMSHDPITLDGVVSLLLDVELEQKGFDQFEGLSLSASVAEGLRRPSQSFGSQGGRSQGHQEDRGVVYDFSANCVAKMVTLLTGVGTVQGKWFIESEVTHHVTTKPGDALDEADYSGADK
ncbi:hypothetical protein F3Y22_tig00110467pilonHSYRG00291 [Hibiscus syriacus]|uniref:Uncharacterized protein n=1 Tax=Hibiscus syriacus TaxID=106335 RepID=A0A6A3AGJ8_HIBSY|nr:hypothetical protein F3Y22_tig00110467pilonHSYRG00291 [Hibiscus syriacus]